MKPKLISTKSLYHGRVFDLSLARIEDSGKQYEREIISHGGSAVIVPVFEDLTVALVSQYRHAAGKYLLEIPAGTIDKGETPEETALREVEEEIGVRADKIVKLTEFYVSPGFLTEKMFVFLASGLTASKQQLDEDEILSVVRFSFDEALEKIETGEIEDAKTMIGLILAGKRFGVGI